MNINKYYNSIEIILILHWVGHIKSTNIINIALIFIQENIAGFIRDIC